MFERVEKMVQFIIEKRLFFIFLNWILRKNWGLVGAFVLLSAILLCGYLLPTLYFSDQLIEAADARTDDINENAKKNKQLELIEYTNLCISEPKISKNYDWYCEEAINLYKSMHSELNPKTAKILKEKAYPLIVLEARRTLRNIEYIKLVNAKPTSYEVVVTKILNWSWVYVIPMTIFMIVWLLYTNRYRANIGVINEVIEPRKRYKTINIKVNEIR